MSGRGGRSFRGGGRSPGGRGRGGRGGGRFQRDEGPPAEIVGTCVYHHIVFSLPCLIMICNQMVDP